MDSIYPPEINSQRKYEYQIETDQKLIEEFTLYIRFLVEFSSQDSKPLEY